MTDQKHLLQEGLIIKEDGIFCATPSCFSYKSTGKTLKECQKNLFLASFVCNKNIPFHIEYKRSAMNLCFYVYRKGKV